MSMLIGVPSVRPSKIPLRMRTVSDSLRCVTIWLWAVAPRAEVAQATDREVEGLQAVARALPIRDDGDPVEVAPAAIGGDADVGGRGTIGLVADEDLDAVECGIRHELGLAVPPEPGE